ncbi:MAG: FAD:protein FMN transferase [Terrimonas sp.]|nr:FAD:protein FMN transferase [Terrimonas sp.]
MAVLFLSLFQLIFSAGETPSYYSISGTAQGTTYHVHYYANDSLVKKSQLDSILDRIDSSLSVYKPYSLISRFNRSDKGITMDDHFWIVLKKSLQTYRDTRGLFDITVAPLVQAWGFGVKRTDTLPGNKQLDQIKTCVGSRYLKVKNNFLRKTKPCVTLDMNGIAQGYSVDVLAEFLERNGIHDYIAELGGEIRVKGRRQPSGEKFRVGIESPAEDEFENHSIQKIIMMDQGAITTSGSYRKYYESDGRKITHLINPITGYPIQNEMISVTVYAKDAITADAFDNALMLMGLKDALQFTEAKKELAAYFIYKKADGTIADTASSQFYKLMNQ